MAEAAAAVINLRRPTWSNPKRAARWRWTHETYACPVIGMKTVDKIAPSDALAVLEPIWTAKPETASRVRQRVETVMEWEGTHGYRLVNPAGRALPKVLPPVSRLQKHHPSLLDAQVPRVLRMVWKSSAHIMTKLALEHLVLTASRWGEARRATWSEVNLAERSWEIPASRMKARRSHKVPLSSQDMDVPGVAWGMSGPDGPIFPVGKADKEGSDMTFTALLRRLEIPAVPHGLRISFRNWTEEHMKGWPAASEAPWPIG